MFDWNEEELGDIIWDEASESDDHIVPYPKGNEEKPLVTFGDHNKKQQSQEASIIKLAEQKTSGVKNDFSGAKLERTSQFNTNEGLSAPGFEMDSWPNLTLTSAECSKGHAVRNSQDYTGVKLPNLGTEMPKLDPTKDDAAQPEDEPGLFGDDYEDKEHGGFLDYSWANIGTFDDLDRILRNDDPIFGCESHGNADELWSSSADIFSSPTKSFHLTSHSPSSGLGALRNTSEQYDIKVEFMQNEYQPVSPSCKMTNDPSCRVQENVDPSKDKSARKDCCTLANPVVEGGGGKRKTFLEKVNEQRKMLKYLEKEEEDEGNLSPDVYANWSLNGHQFQQFGNRLPTSSIQTFPSSVLSPQMHPSGPEPWLYFRPSHLYLPTEYGNPTHQSPVAPKLSHVQSDSDEQQPVLAGHGFSPGSSKHANHFKKFPVPSEPVIMTPQEKIEKLRRRQQLQAMLAIQEQQQQLGQQVPCTVLSNTDNCIQENQSQDTEGSDIHVEENLQCPNPTVEQDDSNTISMVIDDCSLEERVLDQLQDVIRKLDIGIRSSIRDSLFRLAQSAMKRHSAIDTSLTNNSKDENKVIAKEKTRDHNRFTRMPDAETETNPIDRIVAHFLFHRPSESSAGPVKDSDRPESPISAKHFREPKTEGFNLSMGSLSNNSSGTPRLSCPPCTLPEPQDIDQFQTDAYMNTPENASNNDTDYDGIMEVESLQ